MQRNSPVIDGMDTSRMTRAAIYARISQSDKKTPAIKNQIATCQKMASAYGYEVVATFSDDGISAFSGKVRPGFLDLVAGVRSGDFEIILAVAEDRLTRSSFEKFGLQSDCVKAGVRWHTNASGLVDPSTAEGGLLATITGALAEYESAMKVERLRRSVDDRLGRGIDIMGPRPFGYEKDRKTIRKAEAEVLRTAYAMVLDGASLYRVTQMFTDSGVKRDRAKDSAWRPQTIRHILLRERNRGRLVVKGVQYADDLPAIVDDETFESVRAILENPDRTPRRGPKPKTWACVGTVRCGVCGSYLSQTGAQRSGKRNMRCAPDGRPEGFQGVRHPTMECELLDVQLRTLVMAALMGRGLAGTSEAITKGDIPLHRLRLAELVRQRDLTQELATLPGANVAAAKKKMLDLGKAIESARNELDLALSSDIATAAVDVAMRVLRDSEDAARPDDEETGGVEPTAWVEHWQSLSVDDQRTLVLALLPGARLMPRGQEVGGFRVATPALTLAA